MKVRITEDESKTGISSEFHSVGDVVEVDDNMEIVRNGSFSFSLWADRFDWTDDDER